MQRHTLFLYFFSQKILVDGRSTSLFSNEHQHLLPLQRYLIIQLRYIIQMMITNAQLIFSLTFRRSDFPIRTIAMENDVSAVTEDTSNTTVAICTTTFGTTIFTESDLVFNLNYQKPTSRNTVFRL